MATDPRNGPPLSESELVAALYTGAQLFDGGEFWESHEAWEAAWHRAPESERDFFQGLIHAAAACLHHRRGNPHGFQKQRGRLERRLGRYRPHHRDVDVNELLAAIAALPPPGQTAAYPRLRLPPLGQTS